MNPYLTVTIIFILFLLLFVWATFSLRKHVSKVCETLDYLKKTATEVSTNEEIEDFHKEFVGKASKIHNKFIYPELQKIDGYLRGLYKQFQSH